MATVLEDLLDELGILRWIVLGADLVYLSVTLFRTFQAGGRGRTEAYWEHVELLMLLAGALAGGPTFLLASEMALSLRDNNFRRAYALLVSLVLSAVVYPGLRELMSPLEELNLATEEEAFWRRSRRRL